jgi:predicted ester cyclase
MYYVSAKKIIGKRNYPMKTNELAQAFVDAYNAGNLDKVASFLSNDFKFSGPVPEPIDSTEWLGLLRLFKTAFPDINYNLRLVSVEGNVVHTTSQVNGTHTGDLDISAMGMGVFSPTGKTFSLPEEPGEAIVEDDKVKSIHVQSGKGSGVMGILVQLGIQPPSG